MGVSCKLGSKANRHCHAGNPGIHNRQSSLPWRLPMCVPICGNPNELCCWPPNKRVLDCAAHTITAARNVPCAGSQGNKSHKIVLSWPRLLQADCQPLYLHVDKGVFAFFKKLQKVVLPVFNNMQKFLLKLVLSPNLEFVFFVDKGVFAFFKKLQKVVLPVFNNMQKFLLKLVLSPNLEFVFFVDSQP